jgi:hypothetical protein
MAIEKWDGPQVVQVFGLIFDSHKISMLNVIIDSN